jgi:hypothetical protein
VRIGDVGEHDAREVRCAYCAAGVGRPCTTATASRRRADAEIKRSHRARRQAWLDRRARRDAVGDDG